MFIPDILEKGFQIYPYKNKYRVYTSDTYWFIINNPIELTENRFLMQKEIYENKLKQCEDWSKQYWDKIEKLRNDNVLSKEKIWFTADSHFSHPGILTHTDRGFTDIHEHDDSWRDKWNDTIGKKDRIYILGDFYWKNRVGAVALLHKLNGNKFFIIGNHDKAVEGLDNMFESIDDLKTVRFKKEQYPYFEEYEFIVFMEHYPCTSWYQKHRNSLMCHGHVHGNLDNFNDISTDLRVDVGIDAKLAKSCDGFIDLEHLYEFYWRKRILTEGLIENI